MLNQFMWDFAVSIALGGKPDKALERLREINLRSFAGNPNTILMDAAGRLARNGRASEPMNVSRQIGDVDDQLRSLRDIV